VATGQPVWAIATRFPRQGNWTEADYLDLPEGFPRVELSDGHLEVLPMPTDRHQVILTAMLLLLVAEAKRLGGWARPAGLRIRLGTGRFREPDVALLTGANAAKRGEEHWTGADLVVEVVSGGAEDRTRDYLTKRHQYAAAGIGEYWIVDPQEGLITVLMLVGDEYVEHGVFGRGDMATSAAFAGLKVGVDETLDAN
jgi:Uma2 family endonuclease